MIKWKIAQSAEIRWWKKYLKGKKVNEYLDWKKQYWKELIKKCEPELIFSKNISILDAGCGPAGFFIICDQLQVVAFDPLLLEYEEHLPHFKQIFYPNIKFEQSSIEGFSSETQFDLVVCMNAINHVKDIHESYRILGNLVKPGGKLIVSIDAHNYEFFKYIFKILPGDILHPHQYNLLDYNKFISNNDFTIDKVLLLKKEFLFNHFLQIATKKLV